MAMRPALCLRPCTFRGFLQGAQVISAMRAPFECSRSGASSFFAQTHRRLRSQRQRSSIEWNLAAIDGTIDGKTERSNSPCFCIDGKKNSIDGTKIQNRSPCSIVSRLSPPLPLTLADARNPPRADQSNRSLPLPGLVNVRPLLSPFTPVQFF